MNGKANAANFENEFANPGVLDDPWTRLPIVSITAVAAWLMLLLGCGLLLSWMVPAAPGVSEIDARLIELPDNGTHANGAEAARSPASSPIRHGISADTATTDARAMRHQHNKAAPRQARSRHQLRDRWRHFAPAGMEKTADLTDKGRQREQVQNTKKEKATDASTAVKSVTATQESMYRDVSGGGTIGGGRPSETNGAKGGSGGENGGSGPRPIYAPVPVIPDDMRDEVVEATAVVRFHVARDGSATVILITRTDFTALDQMILDTLRNWRFQPATRNGSAVESNAELHLRITIQ
jgi:periplasmic protein TonB